MSNSLYMQNGYSGGVVVSLTILALVLGILVGSFFNLTEMKEAAVNVIQNETSNDTDDANSELSETEKNQPAFTIVISDLPEAQRSALKAMGVDGNEIVVTEGMLACAETKIGADRMNEIRNGTAPSTGESISLFACYSQN